MGQVHGEPWRYLAAPFVYPDVPYLFVTCVGIAIFGIPVERRLGTVATLVLIIACGALGMLAANGIESVIGNDRDVLIGEKCTFMHGGRRHTGHFFGREGFFVGEPEVQVIAKLTSYMRLHAGVGYRFTSATQDLSGVSGSISLQFGR